ncbi:MAG: 23S rRNA pseudouridine(2605) synthase RluB [Aquisalimonadaceae bacterium]
MDEKLQKVLARAGLGSRREIEGWIAQGRVQVNGEPARLGDRVTGLERIRCNGSLVPREKLVADSRKVIAYHKPVGEISSRDDPEGRVTVFDHLPKLGSGRWISIGRLDLNTLGLLLFTNDGELANRLMHPSWAQEREYAVRVYGDVSPEVLKRLQTGVELDDGPARFDSITVRGGEGGNQWYHVTIREGRRREVRRLWESQGVQVSRLIRVRYGPIALPRDLPRGKWRFLKPEQVDALARAVELPITAQTAAAGAPKKRRLVPKPPRPKRTRK